MKDYTSVEIKTPVQYLNMHKTFCFLATISFRSTFLEEGSMDTTVTLLKHCHVIVQVLGPAAVVCIRIASL